MLRFLLAIVLSLGLLPVVAGPGSACLWDREMVPHEKQFKSNYLNDSADDPTSGNGTDGLRSPLGLLASTAGVLMLMGGLVVGLVRAKARQRPQS